jgi:hypothetical protein
LVLLIKIIKDGLKITPFSVQGGSALGRNRSGGDLIPSSSNVPANSYLPLSLTAGLVILIVVNIFSPYVNHPLGIGYLILAMTIIDNKNG